MVTFKEFTQLNEQQRINQLWIRGIYLEIGRKTDKLIIDLYSINDFYAEVYFDRSSEELLYIKPFSSMDKLWPYLCQIDISSVVAV